MTQTLPLVAIVVLNHNGRQHLEACFDSLLAMDYPRELWRLWVVDNGSVDGSVEWVDARPEAQLISNPDNVGFSAALKCIGIYASHDNL